MISVFTPTYNRKYTLPKLYESLCKQTYQDFEWVIVDDGSTDDTNSLIKDWINENKIKIRYHYQHNLGKSLAHNRGVVESKGDLFLCVDSDDYLLEDSLYNIYRCWDRVKDYGYIGILGFIIKPDNTPITRMSSNVKDTTYFESYRKNGLHGDAIMIYNTKIIKKYRFKVAKGEKFIPEGYLYSQLDSEGKLYILRKPLYVREYLDDGYTKNVAKLIYSNYKSYAHHINTRITNYDKGIDVFLDSIRYDSVMIAHKEKGIISKSVYPILAAIGYLPAILIAYKRYGTFMKNPK